MIVSLCYFTNKSQPAIYQMQLSVIIVNYNVKYFLEQCLFTVEKAIAGIDAEIIVADNASTDGSMLYLQPLFPQVRFIKNKTNLGFARANNEALAQCRGDYVLFLNPDTLIPEDSLQKSLLYLQQHPRAGALGVRMIDGRGKFLAESKRSFPSPLSAFCKLTGLAALFPYSGFFNRYALGNTDPGKSHEVEVLAGACMLVRKPLLDTLKGFDERYFLYGEDIDLSYRIRQAGYQNHYFAGTTILHFKGESSRKAGLEYVKHFYGSMLIFVQKYYTGATATGFSFFIKTMIGLRSCLLLLKQIRRPLFAQQQKTPKEKILFCERTMPVSAIIKQVQQKAGKDTRFFFQIAGSRSIVGSDTRSVKDKAFATS